MFWIDQSLVAVFSFLFWSVFIATITIRLTSIGETSVNGSRPPAPPFFCFASFSVALVFPTSSSSSSSSPICSFPPTPSAALVYLTRLRLVLQPAEEDRARDLEGERHLSDRHRHPTHGEAARLQVRSGAHARPRCSLAHIHISKMSIWNDTYADACSFPWQGLHEAGRSGREEDRMYRQFTGEAKDVGIL